MQSVWREGMTARSIHKKVIGIIAAVSFLMGTGVFTTIRGDALYMESENTTSARIIWWICPVGEYSDEEKVEELVDTFEKAHPQIEVDYRILDEQTGVDEIDTAFAENNAPDVVMAAPEDIVTKWGAEGHMADLSQLWDEKTQSEFRPEMRDLSRNREGTWYAVPLFRDLYTMAINYNIFKKAGVLQYLSVDTHSWKDSGFIDAVLRVHDVLVQEGSEAGIVGKVYCKDQNGQRAFMSFVSNFFNTGLVDDYRSSYQVGSSEITNVFTTLRKLGGKGIEFDPEMDGDDENEAFLNGDLFLTFNWSASKQHVAGSDAQVPVEIFDGQLSDINPAEELYVGTNEEPEEELVEEIEEDSSGLRILPMMYPNSKNTPSLTGPVRALGVVETEDEKKKNAAMSFVQFLMSDEDAYRQAVLTAGCFPARRSINGHELTGLYGDDEVMNLYETLNEYYEYYDPTMELYPQLEEAWPELLREIGEGAKIKSITGSLEKDLNKKLEDEYGIKKIDMEE